MPELPEVETTIRGLTPHLQDQRIVAVTVRHTGLRYPVDVDAMQTLVDGIIGLPFRRAKYLLFPINTAHARQYLIGHLGMSGACRLEPAGSQPKTHDHLLITFSNQWVLHYHDPRRFGFWLVTTDWQTHHHFNRLGPEPLSEDFHAHYLSQALHQKRQAIKTTLMDNAIVVGVGNIYANESLFRSRIHPQQTAKTLTKDQLLTLVYAIKTILQQAIAAGGTTLRDFVRPQTSHTTQSNAQPGYFQQTLQVYGKSGEPCPVCGTTIQATAINQRNSFFCPSCQPLSLASLKPPTP